MAMAQATLEGPNTSTEASGTSTSVGAGFLEDTSASFDVDAFKGYILIDSLAAEFDIISNTAIRINVASGTPAAGAYTVEARTGLIFLTPSSDEPTQALVLANAYVVYAKDATGHGIPILPAGPDGAKAALVSGLSGISTPSNAATVLETALAAFWASAATVANFPGSTAVVPPSQSGLASALQTEFDSNTSGSKSLADSGTAVAAAMHAKASNADGDVTISGPSTQKII